MEQSSNETTNQQERQLNLAWLGGLWEGEGTITVVTGSKNRWFPKASIINTDFVLMSHVTHILDENGIGHYVQVRLGGCDGDPRHKDAMVVNIVGMKRVQTFIKAIVHYLHGKKLLVTAEVDGFIQRRLSKGVRPRYDAEDLECIKRIRALNKKGPVESSETTRQPLVVISEPGEDIVQTVQSV